MSATEAEIVVVPTGRRSGASGVVRTVAAWAWEAVSTVLSVVAVMIACLMFVVAVASHFSPAGEYTVFGHPVMTVLSGSMSPVIRTGDLIIDDPVTPAELDHFRPGRVITFRDQGKVFTHRIVAVRTAEDGGLAYVTKGDVNNAADSRSIAPSQIIGAYRSKVPYGGYVLNALHQPTALMLLLASPLLWLASGALFRLAREHGHDGDHDPAPSAGEAEAGAP